MFHMELDTSVFGSNMNLDAIDAATDEVPGINRETATQAFGYACRHGVRLRVAAHWIMRARGMTVRSLAGELDVSASHLNQLFIHPHRHYFHRRKKRLLAERLGFDIWLYPEPLCGDSIPRDLDSLLHGLRLLGMPAGLAANMALDARGIQIERDLFPLLDLGYRAIKRRLDGEVVPSAREQSVLIAVLGFDPWPQTLAT
jgi:hypothetical protein